MSELVADTQQRLQSFVLEANPNADVAPGTAFNELVLKPAATAQNVQYNQIATLDLTNNIQSALASITPTNTAIIDEVASNFLTKRNQGSLTTGVLKITVANPNIQYNVNNNTTFIQPTLGLTYVTTQAYVFGSLVNQLPLYVTNGIAYFFLPVVASAAGSQYAVSTGTAFSLVAPSNINNFVSAVAYGNFSTGTSPQTDQQLIASFQGNLTNESLTNARAISASLSSLYPTFQTLSAIGANDPEMIRSKRNFLGTSTFGKADIYIRTAPASQTLTITEIGTKVSTGIWTLNIGANDAPGFYRIISIIPTPAANQTISGTLVVTNITFGFTPDLFTSNNVITNAFDARFSSYQTAAVTFSYTEIPTVPIGTTASFSVTVSYQPYINAIQSLFQSPETRPLCGDYLIKAALPCYVSMNIVLHKVNLTDTLASIGGPNLIIAIFNYVNSIPFGQVLSVSEIVHICHTFPIASVELPLVVNGLIYTSNDTTISLSSSDFLTIPTSLADGVTPNTTLYFIDYFTNNGIANIGLTLI